MIREPNLGLLTALQAQEVEDERLIEEVDKALTGEDPAEKIAQHLREGLSSFVGTIPPKQVVESTIKDLLKELLATPVQPDPKVTVRQDDRDPTLMRITMEVPYMVQIVQELKT